MNWVEKPNHKSNRFFETQSKKVFLKFIKYNFFNNFQIVRRGEIILSSWVYLFKPKRRQQRVYISANGTFLLENAI